MNDFMGAAIIIGIVSYAIYKLFALFVHKKERLMLIDKLNQFSSQGSVKVDLSFCERKSDGKFIALRVGLTLCGIGAGLLIGYMIINLSGIYEQYIADGNYRVRELVTVINFGSALFGGGLGTMAAFLIEHKMTRNNK